MRCHRLWAASIAPTLQHFGTRADFALRHRAAIVRLRGVMLAYEQSEKAVAICVNLQP